MIRKSIFLPAICLFSMISVFAAPDITLRISSYNNFLKVAGQLTNKFQPGMGDMLPMQLGMVLGNMSFEGADLDAPIYLHAEISFFGTMPMPQPAIFIPVKDFDKFVAGFSPQSQIITKNTIFPLGGYAVIVNKGMSIPEEKLKDWVKSGEMLSGDTLLLFRGDQMLFEKLKTLALTSFEKDFKISGDMTEKQFEYMKKTFSTMIDTVLSLEYLDVKLDLTGEFFKYSIGLDGAKGSALANSLVMEHEDSVEGLSGLYDGKTKGADQVVITRHNEKLLDDVLGWFEKTVSEFPAEKENEKMGVKVISGLLASVRSLNKKAAVDAAYTLVDYKDENYTNYIVRGSEAEITGEIESLFAQFKEAMELVKAEIKKEAKDKPESKQEEIRNTMKFFDVLVFDLQKNVSKLNGQAVHRLNLFDLDAYPEIVNLLTLAKQEASIKQIRMFSKLFLTHQGNYLLFADSMDELKEMAARVKSGKLKGKTAMGEWDLRELIDYKYMMNTAMQGNPAVTPEMAEKIAGLFTAPVQVNARCSDSIEVELGIPVEVIENGGKMYREHMMEMMMQQQGGGMRPMPGNP